MQRPTQEEANQLMRSIYWAVQKTRANGREATDPRPGILEWINPFLYGSEPGSFISIIERIITNMDAGYNVTGPDLVNMLYLIDVKAPEVAIPLIFQGVDIPTIETALQWVGGWRHE